MSEQDSGQQPDQQPRFDPMTGKRIEADPAAQEPLFDPMTGKRLAQREPRRGALAAVAAAVLVLVGGGVTAAVLLTGGADSAEDSTDTAEQARAEACQAELEPVYDALIAVDGRMNTGANIQAFSDIVGQAASALNAVDSTVIAENDCGMHEALSEIVVQYGAIGAGWNDCIFEHDYCDTDDPRDVNIGGALTSVGGNLEGLGSDMSLTSSPAMNTSSSKIADMVTY